MTRHARTILPELRPLDSFGQYVWICYFITYMNLILASIIAMGAFKYYYKNNRLCMHHWSLSLIISILSPQFNGYKKFLKFAIFFQLILASLICTFKIFYGMDLRAVLVSQSFEEVVEGWGQMEFLRTKVVFAVEDINDCKSYSHEHRNDMVTCLLAPSHILQPQ